MTRMNLVTAQVTCMILVGGTQDWHQNNPLMRINYKDIRLGFVTEDHLRIRTGMKSEKVDLA